MAKSPGKKKKGKSKYMKYPEYTLTKLGKSMMSIDFIGPMYLKGSGNRIIVIPVINYKPRDYTRLTQENKLLTQINADENYDRNCLIKILWL